MLVKSVSTHSHANSTQLVMLVANY